MINGEREPREIPRAIIEWLDSLDAPPTVRAQGRTSEESGRMRRDLERVLMVDSSDE
jgi:hypothetical protein